MLCHFYYADFVELYVCDVYLSFIFRIHFMQHRLDVLVIRFFVAGSHPTDEPN